MSDDATGAPMAGALQEPDATIELTERLAGSKKLKHLPYSTIRDVVQHEWGRHKRTKDTLAHCRRRLHKILANYLCAVDVEQAESRIERVFESGDDELIDDTLRHLLSSHASTRERLPYMDSFFEHIFEMAGPPESIADLACAMTPLSFRWMSLSPETRYFAFDINPKYLRLINRYFALEGVPSQTFQCDILVDPIDLEVDLCFLFKMYHCLEIRRKGAGWQAVERAPGRAVAITFPTMNLRGQTVDIAKNYRAAIDRGVEANGWQCCEREAYGEQIVVVRKS